MKTAIETARKLAAESSAKVAILESHAPHIYGEPRHMIPHAGKLMVCYTLNNGTELAELLSAHPPLAGVAYRGTFAGFKLNDEFSEERENAKEWHNVCGVTFEVSDTHTVGAYPCNEAPLSCQWYSDTPAGRLNIRVKFTYHAGTHWPFIAKKYKATKENRVRSNIVESWHAANMPAGYQVHFRFSNGGDNTRGGSVSFFFAEDDNGDRDAFISNLD